MFELCPLVVDDERFEISGIMLRIMEFNAVSYFEATWHGPEPVCNRLSKHCHRFNFGIFYNCESWALAFSVKVPTSLFAHIKAVR
jgi:hypothetical protein